MYKSEYFSFNMEEVYKNFNREILNLKVIVRNNSICNDWKFEHEFPATPITM